MLVVSGKGDPRFKHDLEVQEALWSFINSIDDIYQAVGLKLSYKELQRVQSIKHDKKLRGE